MTLSSSVKNMGHRDLPYNATTRMKPVVERHPLRQKVFCDP
jgi:hypothetical protein